MSRISKCQSSEARRLVIFDIFRKLDNEIHHIGGTYTDENPDLWFYYSVTPCPGGYFLLSLFVCHRRAGVFSIGINELTELTFTQKSDCPQPQHLSETLSWHTFMSAQANEHHFIKALKFTKTNVESMENNFLYIPIKIETSCKQILNSEEVKQIKLRHDFGDLLNKEEDTDFILESITKRQFPVHKAILAAHSPVLKKFLQHLSSNTAIVDINDDDMELLLEFIYTGTLRNVHKLDHFKLLEIADRFQLKDLFLLAQYMLLKNK